MNHIKDRNFIQIDNIETHIDSYSNIGTKLTYTQSDVIFLDDNIFLLTFNKQRIIEISNGTEMFPFVHEHFGYSSKTYRDNILEIKGRTSLGEINITLNFINKNLDVNKHL